MNTGESVIFSGREDNIRSDNTDDKESRTNIDGMETYQR